MQIQEQVQPRVETSVVAMVDVVPDPMQEALVVAVVELVDILATVASVYQHY
jgi:hypothetical protein